MIKENTYKLQHIYLTSGDGDEYPGCKLHLALGRWYAEIKLPQMIRPFRQWVDLSNCDWANTGGYWKYSERKYGVSLFENHLSIYYGRQTEGREEKRWGYFLPWNEWRFVRFSLYDLEGKHFWTMPEKMKGGDFGAQYKIVREAEERVPKVGFRFKDFDGEEIEATTRIEEREWLRGDGWFKWLSVFYKPRIRRSLDIEFSKEVGPRKGSWKGGTLGHGIEMNPGELHEEAFNRYCEEHSIQYLGREAK
jgi:hypothetical protein